VSVGAVFPLLANDDVIQDGNPEQLASLDQSLGDSNIFPAGLRIPRRMIMGHDDRSDRTKAKSGAEDFSVPTDTCSTATILCLASSMKAAKVSFGEKPNRSRKTGGIISGLVARRPSTLDSAHLDNVDSTR
jgi:hypothetical protein